MSAMAIALPRCAIALPDGGTAQSLIARLAPPLDREVVEPGLGEMMGDDFRPGCGALGVIAQNFRRAAVQHLAAALEQAVVGGVLDQRVLETIVRLRAPVLGDEEVRIEAAGLSSADWRAGSSTPPTARNNAWVKLRLNTAPICATSRASPSRSSRAACDCGSVGGIACNPPASPRSSRSRVTLLDKERHAAGALAYAFDDFRRQRALRRDFGDHALKRAPRRAASAK